MTTDNRNSDENLDAVERLIQLSGEPMKMPDAVCQRIERVARPTWIAVVKQNSRKTRLRRFFRPVLAFSVAVLVAAFWLFQSLGIENELIASINSTVGVVETRSSNGEIRTADRLATGPDSYAIVEYTQGRLVRMDADTTITFVSNSTIQLDDGAVYVDSGADNRAAEYKGLTIQTAYGTASDIGTQFETRIQDDSLRVRVREGRVEIGSNMSDRSPYELEAGEELKIEGGGHVRRQPIPTYGPDWQWLNALPLEIEIEDRTLHAFLTWISREQGWTLAYQNPKLEAESRGVTLHGSVAGLTPSDALNVVAATSSIDYAIDGGTLRISAKGAAE